MCCWLVVGAKVSTEKQVNPLHGRREVKTCGFTSFRFWHVAMNSSSLIGSSLGEKPSNHSWEYWRTSLHLSVVHRPSKSKVYWDIDHAWPSCPIWIYWYVVWAYDFTWSNYLCLCLFSDILLPHYTGYAMMGGTRSIKSMRVNKWINKK